MSEFASLLDLSVDAGVWSLTWSRLSELASLLDLSVDAAGGVVTYLVALE